MKLNLIALLLALSVALSIAAAAPANDLPPPASVEGTIIIPNGAVLVGQVINGAFELTAMTPDAANLLTAPMMGGPGQIKACDNDIRGSAGMYHWTPVSTVPLWGVRLTNTASARECVAETHTGPVAFMQFRTGGDFYGAVHAQGCAEQSCGYYQIACNPVGSATGFPDPEGWGTLQRGRDTTCTWGSYGPQPHEWTAWSASVGNAHVWEGTASVLFV